MRKMLLNWSKTDNLDLMAIVHAIIYGHGTSRKLTNNRMDELKKLTRARRELVNEQSSIKNQVRVHVDFIFREFQGKMIFQDGKKEKVKPFTDIFGKSGKYFMRNCLHPSDILSLGKEGLRELSIREDLKLRDSTIHCLLDFAQSSISKSKDQVEVEQFLLNLRLDQLDVVNKQIKKLEREIEDLFIQTESAVILSVPGIGVSIGAELASEMGDISDFEHAGKIIKMAGTNPIVKQSGDRKPSYYAVSKQGRKQFRNVVYQVGKSLATNNSEMNEKYQALLDRGKAPRQAYIALGNRMIRLAYSMIKHQTLYRSSDKNYSLLNQIDKKLKSKNKKLFFEKFVLTSEIHSA
jgi:transposase